jgi:VWFA-related protein
MNPVSEHMPDPTLGFVRVDVSATDKSGKPVLGLSKSDFKLLDNDQPAKVVTFQAFVGARAQPADSVEAALVLDELNMPATARIGGKDFSEAVAEVGTFLRANGGTLEHPTIVYRLNEDGLFASRQVSMNGNQLADEIEEPGKMRRVWTPSDINKDVGHIGKDADTSWSVIMHSLVALGSISIEERRRPGRKLLFWIGNGWQVRSLENQNVLGLSDFSIELLTRMREARITLWGATEWPLYDPFGNPVPVTDYVAPEFVEGSKPDATDVRYLSLRVIAARSGGGVIAVKSNLAATIGERVKEANQFYSLTFDPPRTSVMDEYHHLKVEIDKPDVSAHVFADYYDQPGFYDQPPVKQLITVKEFESLIANAHGNTERELANQLNGMQLSERLSSARMTALAKSVHGKGAREAFEVVADESAFLAPPADEIPSKPAPDTAMQRQIISRILSYINTAIPRLPDFFAKRTTVQYHEPSPKPDQTWKTAWPNQAMHEGDTETASVRVHDGKEVAESQSMKNARAGSEQLTTRGAFGPVLATVMGAATMLSSEITWSRWEQGEKGDLAVFRYRVPQQIALFSVGFCCLAVDSGAFRYETEPPFHGEITVDPSTGTIFRLTIQADLAWRLPLERSDVMVEYGPVIKGASSFICPLRSISISRQRRTMAIDEWAEHFKVYGPFETLLNEMRFEKYRIFGSTSRVLPGFVEVPKEK